jgi:hypothetical protein
MPIEHLLQPVIDNTSASSQGQIDERQTAHKWWRVPVCLELLQLAWCIVRDGFALYGASFCCASRSDEADVRSLAHPPAVASIRNPRETRLTPSTD